MNTRKLRKAILTLCSALLLVSLSVGITLAYLVDDDAVTNTFTVGKVVIKLDEANVDENGKQIEDDPTTEKDESARVTENEYHLLPGHSYLKDPTVWVDEDSEECFLYVKVQNDLSDIEVTAGEDLKYATIEEQMAELGWKKIDGTDVYYATQTKDGETTSVFAAGDSKVVFNGFSISGDVAEAELEDYATEYESGEIVEGTTLIVVNAYAIQADGFNGDAEAAWKANALTSTKFN